MMFDFIQVRIIALWHWVRWHRVEWKRDADDTCPGDISCETCGMVFWCRWYDPKWLGGGKHID